LLAKLFAGCTKPKYLFHVFCCCTVNIGLNDRRNTKDWIYGDNVLAFSTHFAKLESNSGIAASFGPEELPPPNSPCSLAITY
jgi:hypothetical protein